MRPAALPGLCVVNVAIFPGVISDSVRRNNVDFVLRYA